MNPVNFPESNANLQKPRQMSNRACGTLPILTDGKQCMSCWQMSRRERWSALFFGRIWMWVFSGAPTQPPVSLLAADTVFPRPAGRLARLRNAWCGLRSRITAARRRFLGPVTRNGSQAKPRGWMVNCWYDYLLAQYVYYALPAAPFAIFSRWARFHISRWRHRPSWLQKQILRRSVILSDRALQTLAQCSDNVTTALSRVRTAHKIISVRIESGKLPGNGFDMIAAATDLQAASDILYAILENPAMPAPADRYGEAATTPGKDA